jgi:ComF family protein
MESTRVKEWRGGTSFMVIVETLRSLFTANDPDGQSSTDSASTRCLGTRRPTLVSRLLPSRCLLCNDLCGAEPAGSAVICAPCHAALARTGDESCPRCRLPASNGEVCGRCLRYPPRWNELHASFIYSFPMDRLIVGAKHAQHWGVFDWVAQTTPRWPFARNATLIPVPASAERIEERGYNQATLLAQSLAKRFDLRVDNAAVARIRATETQARRNWVERRKNVKDAFTATRSMKGESIVLIDDVLTTGATLNECARAAIDAGAVTVDAFVIARVNAPRARDRIAKFGHAVT